MTPTTSPATPTAPQRHEQKFEARRDQVCEARRFLADILDGCPSADDAILITSELATNAVLHSASNQPGGTFTIAAEIREGHHIRIEARDDGGPWHQTHHHDNRPHGLDIIATLATSHGVSGDPLTGWTTWAIIPWHGPADQHQPPPHEQATMTQNEPGTTPGTVTTTTSNASSQPQGTPDMPGTSQAAHAPGGWLSGS